MGLKIRRLKGGFAYYAEYKFGERCIYETIRAHSSREAKKIYAARYKELRGQLPPQPAARPISVSEARDSQISAVLVALLRVLVSRHVFSDAEVREILTSAFAHLDRAHGSAAAARACEELRQRLLAEFPGQPAIVAAADALVRDAVQAPPVELAPPLPATISGAAGEPIEIAKPDSDRVHG